MRLAIFIPAYNEEVMIGAVIKNIPDKFKGVSEYKIFIIDDGSTDKTVEIANVAAGTGMQNAERGNGESPTEIIRINPHQGLANAFKTGLKASLDWKADLICHLDADGQYAPQEIPLVLAPILEGHADMVTGNRQVENLKFLGWQRRYGNILGSWFLRALTGLNVKDASCGFRAYSKKAAQMLEVHSTHTYTHETLIEARYKGIRLVQTPITFLPRGNNLKGGKQPQRSRLTKNLFKHIFKSLTAILAANARYKNKQG
jgi:glycosyltransferase involved in cell wall biosynthesis